MEDHSLRTFYVRGLLQMVVSALTQLPPHLQLRVDSDAFMRAFEYGPLSNATLLKPWDLAPGWKRHVETSVNSDASPMSPLSATESL
jgi:hypothetical protein